MTKSVWCFVVLLCMVTIGATSCSHKDSGPASNGPLENEPMSLGNVNNLQSKSWQTFDVDVWTDGRTMPPFHGLRILLRFTPKDAEATPPPKSLKLRLRAQGSACDVPTAFNVEHDLDKFATASTADGETYIIAIDDSLGSNQTRWASPTPQSNQLKLRDGELRVSVQLVSRTASGGEDKLDFDDLTIKCETLKK